MMSTIGRSPVIAAPTPRPVMPASEIGESSTRSGPNSSTSPDSTLNGVPASATSSPITKTAGSRRSSSASASLIACAKVSSRVATALGVDIVRHLAGIGKRRLERDRDAALDLAAHLVLDRLQAVLLGDPGLEQPVAEAGGRVALVAPELLLVLGPVVRAVDVADVVAVVAVRVALQERRPLATARTLDQALHQRVHRAHVLPVDVQRVDPERTRPVEHVAGRRLEVMRVLVVEVVLADVEDRQHPQGRHVHDLVQDPLSQRSLADEADGNLVGATALRREGGAGGDPGRAGNDRVRAEVAVRVVGDVHRTALALAVAGLLAEQLGEHPVNLGALREAVSVAAVRRGDVVVPPERGADADRNALLAGVQMSEPRHLRAPIQVVHLLLEQADLH